MDLCCVICLENEKKTNMIEYNHCGIYYIHSSCLNKWDINDCIICRKQIIPEIEVISTNTNTILNTNTPRTPFIKYLCWFCS